MVRARVGLCKYHFFSFSQKEAMVKESPGVRVCVPIRLRRCKTWNPSRPFYHREEDKVRMRGEGWEVNFFTELGLQRDATPW